MSRIVLDCHRKERGKKVCVCVCRGECDTVPGASSKLSGCVESPRATHLDDSVPWQPVTCPLVCLPFSAWGVSDLSGLKLKYTSSWMDDKGCDLIPSLCSCPSVCLRAHPLYHRNPSIIAKEHNGREWVEREESWESAASGWANYPTGQCFFLVRLPFSAAPPCVIWRCGQGSRKMKGTPGNPQAYIIQRHISDILLLNPSRNISYNPGFVYFSQKPYQLRLVQ